AQAACLSGEIDGGVYCTTHAQALGIPWSYVIFDASSLWPLPDTSSSQIDNLVGTDPAGYAGLEDRVDWHWDRIFADAVLTTLLSVGAELAAPVCRCASLSTATWYCDCTSRYSSIGEYRHEHEQAAARAAAQERERQADLCVSGPPEG